MGVYKNTARMYVMLFPNFYAGVVIQRAPQLKGETLLGADQGGCALFRIAIYLEAILLVCLDWLGGLDQELGKEGEEEEQGQEEER